MDSIVDGGIAKESNLSGWGGKSGVQERWSLSECGWDGGADLDVVVTWSENKVLNNTKSESQTASLEVHSEVALRKISKLDGTFGFGHV